MGSRPSGTTAKPHGNRATPLESCPSITGRRAAPSTGAYVTAVDSQGLVVLLSWRIHSPPCPVRLFSRGRSLEKGAETYVCRRWRHPIKLCGGEKELGSQREERLYYYNVFFQLILFLFNQVVKKYKHLVLPSTSQAL
jgi:hypothetical protein